MGTKGTNETASTLIGLLWSIINKSSFFQIFDLIERNFASASEFVPEFGSEISVHQ